MVAEDVVDELELSGPASRNLTLGLAVGPEPRRVYVAVPNRVHGERMLRILVRRYKLIGFLDGSVQLLLVEWHEVLVGAIVNEV